MHPSRYTKIHMVRNSIAYCDTAAHFYFRQTCLPVHFPWQCLVAVHLHCRTRLPIVHQCYSCYFHGTHHARSHLLDEDEDHWHWYEIFPSTLLFAGQYIHLECGVCSRTKQFSSPSAHGCTGWLLWFLEPVGVTRVNTYVKMRLPVRWKSGSQSDSVSPSTYPSVICFAAAIASLPSLYLLPSFLTCMLRGNVFCCCCICLCVSL